jgi:hypothetical protein
MDDDTSKCISPICRIGGSKQSIFLIGFTGFFGLRRLVRSEVLKEALSICSFEFLKRSRGFNPFLKKRISWP